MNGALAAVEYLIEIEAQQPARSVPPGVIPDLLAPSSGPSMSLGSRRLCTDPASRPNRHRGEHLVIDPYENPVIACIEWRRVTFYKQRTPDPSTAKEPRSTDSNLTRGIFNGFMSPATRRKVRKSVSTWIRSVMLYRAEIKRRYDPGRAYPVFLTVTLPSDQVHRDAMITRKCLIPFLAALKRIHGMEHYFWRAESQENGRIHYHILTDRYIRAEDLQATWNHHVNALGYVDRYFDATGSATPPSTEVHRITDKVKDRKTGQWRSVDPVDYLLDYVLDAPRLDESIPDPDPEAYKTRKLIGRSRGRDGSITTYTARAIDGRVWGMSDSLRSIREPRAHASVRLITALEEARGKDQLRRVDTDHSTMFFGDVSLVLGRSHRGMWQLIKDHYINVFAHLYPDQLPEPFSRGRTFWDPVDLWIDLQDFALYNKPAPVLDGEQADRNEEELTTWIWATIDGLRTHIDLKRYLDRYPQLRKYSTP